MGRFEDLTGKRFSHLVSQGRSDRRCRKGDLSFEKVLCDCGSTKEVRRHDIIHGRVKSCGCKRTEMISIQKTKHGHGHGTATYRAWASALHRCENPNNKSFYRYGGRGISVCERWRYSFENFLSDMGEKPPGTHLDRRDNNGNYTPENCRWVSPMVNGNNTSRCRKIEVFGRTKTISEWSRKFGLEPETVRRRLDMGWSPERSLTSRPTMSRALKAIVRLIDESENTGAEDLKKLIDKIRAVATSEFKANRQAVAQGDLAETPLGQAYLEARFGEAPQSI